ncbi:MAG: YigZ family protein [Balneolaceae bacterium]|nr:YigZ family protein [Balneolaceae bacterium]MCH8548164.1 YigZ family protein [Balneolaceae bacterium]
MHTVTATYKSDYRVKGSKFLGYLAPANSRKEAELALEKVRNEHKTATHHCYAFRINPSEPQEFDQDDGEPRGTAGMPILNAMRSAELMNAIVISVRYYGGTKLGKAGMIEAYGQSATLAIENALLKKILSINTYRIVYEYTNQSIIEKFKNDFTLIELESDYKERVSLTFGIPSKENKRFSAAINKEKHLFAEAEVLEDSYHVVQ